MSENIIELKNIKKVFDDTVVVQDFNLTVKKGEFVTFLGPSGCGKTTTLRMIAGFEFPTEGEILLNGEAPGVETKKIVSYLPDRNYLGRQMRVSEVIDYYSTFYENFRPERASSMLDSLEIDRRARLSSLSKGTLEKVQLILVMSRDADLYLLDEPIGGVDPAARDYILQTILTNYNENATVLLSTHLISDIENILDRVLFLRSGQLALNASVDEIRTEYRKSVDTLFREVFKC